MSDGENSRRRAVTTKCAACICAAAIAGLFPPIPTPAADAQSSVAQGPATATLPALEPPVKDNQVFTHVLLDQFEGRSDGGDNELRWDGEAWAGTDMNRLWLKSEGFADTTRVTDGDQEALYDRPIPRMRYFDAQAGVREDLDSYPSRSWAAIGIEGLAPYFFKISPTLYIRSGWRIGGRVSGYYDVLLTQRWIVQPEAEVYLYSKDDPQRRVGSGLSELDTGLRLRYEVSRKFAPYIGFAYNGNYGNTAVDLRRAGEAASKPRFVFGLRLWY